MEKLTGSDELKAQDFVLKTQKTATEEGFKNVSKLWYDKTLSFEQAFEAMMEDKNKTEDIETEAKNVSGSVNNKDEFVIKVADGREFKPTKHAIGQIGVWLGTGTWFLDNLTENPTDQKGRQKYARDRQDAETLATVVNNGLRRLDKEKKFLFRTSIDGTLRAMLSERYACVDNRWFLDVLKILIPDGRVSHWKGNSDTMFGNILIPDTIREEKDSDYGGMLSVGNSEIGERRISSMPSIFRAICMNGCIWGQEKGEGISQVHRGAIDLQTLFEKIKTNLELQIPLLPRGIDQLLMTRSMIWNDNSIKPLFAQVSKEEKLSKKQASALLLAYNKEVSETPDYAKTWFSVINSLTRAGQTQDNMTWVKFDEIGGKFASYTEEDFNNIVKKAQMLKVKEVEDAFSTAV